jgi:hypothetical protein
VAGHRREREGRAANTNPSNSMNTGALAPMTTGRSYTGSFDFEEMITSLRELFTHDRQVASQPDNKRCGICYLYFTAGELHYREEEGFYVCLNCERALGKQNLPMVRRQQK